MKTILYNQKGEEVKKIELPDEIFGLELNQELLHQVVVSQMSNKRQSSAQTKDRGDVSGGGRKPWRQKGTGRARHGSRRSPIWVGGGVTFGPSSEKSYKKRIPLKMKRKALLIALSAKLRDKELLVIDSFGVEDHKTAPMKRVLNALPMADKSGLIVLPKVEREIVLSVRNIPKTETIEARNITALDILSFKRVIITPEVVEEIKEVIK